jgi:hypothetical protein
MFLRTFFIGVLCAFAGALVLGVASYISGKVSPEDIYWVYWLFACAIGFFAGAVVYLVGEYFDLRERNLWRRLFPRKRD